MSLLEAIEKLNPFNANLSDHAGLTREDKIKEIAPYAEALQQKSNIPASVTIAQWLQETGGKLSAMGNNLFGVKAGGSWNGDTFNAPTWEEVHGQRVETIGTFRSYGSILEAFIDRGSFLGTDRYKDVRQSDPYKAVDALQSAGYATDSNYASALKDLIKQYDLTQYDSGKGIQGWLQDRWDYLTQKQPSAIDDAVDGITNGSKNPVDRWILDKIGVPKGVIDKGIGISGWGATAVIIGAVLIMVVLIILLLKGGGENGG